MDGRGVTVLSFDCFARPLFINQKNFKIMAKKKLSPLELKLKKMVVLALAKFATKAEASADFASVATCGAAVDELI